MPARILIKDESGQVVELYKHWNASQEYVFPLIATASALSGSFLYLSRPLRDSSVNHLRYSAPTIANALILTEGILGGLKEGTFPRLVLSDIRSRGNTVGADHIYLIEPSLRYGIWEVKAFKKKTDEYEQEVVDEVLKGEREPERTFTAYLYEKELPEVLFQELTVDELEIVESNLEEMLNSGVFRGDERYGEEVLNRVKQEIREVAGETDKVDLSDLEEEVGISYPTVETLKIPKNRFTRAYKLDKQIRELEGGELADA